VSASFSETWNLNPIPQRFWFFFFYLSASFSVPTQRDLWKKPEQSKSYSTKALILFLITWEPRFQWLEIWILFHTGPETLLLRARSIPENACATRLIYMRDITVSYARHDAFKSATRCFAKCDTTYSYVQHGTLTRLIYMWDITVSYARHDAFIYHISDMMRGGGLGSRPKNMYGERLGDGVEYHLMKPTPRR